MRRVAGDAFAVAACGPPRALLLNKFPPISSRSRSISSISSRLIKRERSALKQSSIERQRVHCRLRPRRPFHKGSGLEVFLWSLGGGKVTELGRDSPLADSYVAAAARDTGSAAEEAATRKTAKYSNIQVHHIFQPVDVESLSPIYVSGRVFLYIYLYFAKKAAHT